MQGLAADAAILKSLAGVPGERAQAVEPVRARRALVARRGAKPPSRPHALDTVQGALDALGLDDRHRGIVVAHADTDSPHVHVLVSRVCPERGRAVKVTKPAVRRLQRWAVDYERRTGGVVIDNRVRRQQARAAFTAEVAALKAAGVPEKDAVDVTRENNPLPPQRPPPRRPREAHRDRASRVAGTERAPARPARPAPGPGQGRAGPVGTAPPWRSACYGRWLPGLQAAGQAVARRPGDPTLGDQRADGGRTALPAGAGLPRPAISGRRAGRAGPARRRGC